MKLPQLSLRDLFWLVLVAAILCGWWMDRRKLVEDNETRVRKHLETSLDLLDKQLRLQTEIMRRELKSEGER